MNKYSFSNGGYGVNKNLTLGFSIPAINLSKTAQKRLKWFDYYRMHNNNASLTCRYFGISRKTFYKWVKRYNPKYLHSLNDQSKCPKRIRHSKKLYEFGGMVKSVRELHPTWSKYKIGAVLRAEGIHISDSTIGYILKKKNLINLTLSKRRARVRKRNSNKIRIKDIEITINKPGALIQIDTKEYIPTGESKKYQFTAVDCYSRKRRLKGYGSKTASCGRDFLLNLISTFPFKIENILTDNGSEFMKEFDDECKRQGIKHYWTMPESPNQNAYVESSHNIDQKEFYEVYYIACGLKGFNEALQKWEHEYNTIRPHGSIKFMAPDKYLETVKITA